MAVPFNKIKLFWFYIVSHLVPPPPEKKKRQSSSASCLSTPSGFGKQTIRKNPVKNRFRVVVFSARNEKSISIDKSDDDFPFIYTAISANVQEKKESSFYLTSSRCVEILQFGKRISDWILQLKPNSSIVLEETIVNPQKNEVIFIFQSSVLIKMDTFNTFYSSFTENENRLFFTQFQRIHHTAINFFSFNKINKEGFLIIYVKPNKKDFFSLKKDDLGDSSSESFLDTKKLELEKEASKNLEKKAVIGFEKEIDTDLLNKSQELRDVKKRFREQPGFLNSEKELNELSEIDLKDKSVNQFFSNFWVKEFLNLPDTPSLNNLSLSKAVLVDFLNTPSFDKKQLPSTKEGTNFQKVCLYLRATFFVGGYFVQQMMFVPLPIGRFDYQLIQPRPRETTTVRPLVSEKQNSARVNFRQPRLSSFQVSSVGGGTYNYKFPKESSIEDLPFPTVWDSFGKSLEKEPIIVIEKTVLNKLTSPEPYKNGFDEFFASDEVLRAHKRAAQLRFPSLYLERFAKIVNYSYEKIEKICANAKRTESGDFNFTRKEKIALSRHLKFGHFACYNMHYVYRQFDFSVNINRFNFFDKAETISPNAQQRQEIEECLSFKKEIFENLQLIEPHTDKFYKLRGGLEPFIGPVTFLPTVLEETTDYIHEPDHWYLPARYDEPECWPLLPLPVECPYLLLNPPADEELPVANLKVGLDLGENHATTYKRILSLATYVAPLPDDLLLPRKF